MQTQSEPDLRESQLLRDFHSESIPLQIQIQIQMGETFSRTDRQEARSKSSETLRRYETSWEDSLVSVKEASQKDWDVDLLP
jgi:hypothetical protein